MNTRLLIPMAALLLAGCSSPRSRQPDPIRAGYAARQHAGLQDGGGASLPIGPRTKVAVLIHDDSGCVSPEWLAAFPGLRVHCDGYTVDFHAAMVASVAIQPLVGIGSHDSVLLSFMQLVGGTADPFTRSLDLVEFALTDGYSVILNNSWAMGRGTYSDARSREIWTPYVTRLGRLLADHPRLFVTFAAGNERMVETGYPQSMLADLPVIVAGATEATGRTASFTSYGKAVRHTAHGQDVDVLDEAGKWKRVSGTSFSAPNVAGLAARWMLEGATRDQVLERLLASVERDDGIEYPNPVLGLGDTSNARQAVVAAPVRPSLLRRGVLRVLPTRTVDLPEVIP